MMTIVAPAGKSVIKDKEIPIKTEKIAKINAQIKAFLKLLASCKAETAGITSKAETNITPTTLIAKTTEIAVKEARTKLRRLTFTPLT